MLVLSRCPNEGIEILGDGLRIEVEVVEARRTRVRLALSGPNGVHFVRSEISPFFSPDPSRPRRGGALLLGRKLDEKILVHLPSGEVGEIIIVRVHGNQVRLGFEFSLAFKIIRKELTAK